jgi:hypothetical protein
MKIYLKPKKNNNMQNNQTEVKKEKRFLLDKQSWKMVTNRQP